MSENRELGNECIEEASKILGISVEEAQASFGSWMNETFPDMWDMVGKTIDGLDDDDYNDFADMFVCANRPTGGGGGSGEEWVGAFIGFDRRIDLMKRKREMAIDIATADLSGAINNGFTYNGNKVGIGRAFTADGVWRAEHSAGTFVSTVASDTTPDWVIPLNEKLSICMLKPDNTPQRASALKSVWAFHGNTKEQFLEIGPIAITVEGAFEAAKHDWKLWTPVTIKGKFDEEGWKGSGATLTVSSPNAEYGLDWVPDGKKRETCEKLFVPDQYLTTTGECAVNVKDLLQHHLDNRRESYVDRNGVQRYDGALVCVVGGVMDINHEGRETEWDPTGRDYYLSISTQVLRRENPNARIGIKVGGLLKENHNGLSVLKGGEWVPFAKGSRIWVVGRTDSYMNQDGDEVVSIQAQGIYAIPHKSIPARKPSEDSNDLGNLSGFGVGGDE